MLPIQTIILDQPIERSFLLIKNILPSARRIGILFSPMELSNQADISRKADAFDLMIHQEVIQDESEIGRKLSLLLNNIDVLLAQPNIKIYNKNTVAKILVASYRKKIPVIGFSAAYVKAGALAAVYSSPDDVAEDITESIAHYLRHGKISTNNISPDSFSVSINSKVGHSLNIQIDAEPDEIARYIRDEQQ